MVAARIQRKSRELKEVSLLRSKFLQNTPHEFLPTITETFNQLNSKPNEPSDRTTLLAKACLPLITEVLSLVSTRGTGQPRRGARELQNSMLPSLREDKNFNSALRRYPKLKEFCRRISLSLFELEFNVRDLKRPMIRKALAMLLIDRYKELLELGVPPSIMKKRGHLLDPKRVKSIYEDAIHFFGPLDEKGSLTRTVATLVLGNYYSSASQAWKKYEGAINKLTKMRYPGNKDKKITNYIATLILTGKYDSVEEALRALVRTRKEVVKRFSADATERSMIGTVVSLVFGGKYPNVDAIYDRYTTMSNRGQRFCKEYGYDKRRIPVALRLTLSNMCPNVEIAIEYLCKHVEFGRYGHRGAGKPILSLSEFLAQNSKTKLTAVS